MIEEILPGVVHWSAFHEGVGQTVYSSFVLSSGTLIDPIGPEEGLDAIQTLATPRLIVLTNRHHCRNSEEFVKRFACPVLCHQAGLAEFNSKQQVLGFAFDEQLTDNVRALELGSICAEETTLLLEVGGGALSFGDGLIRAEDGSLTFVPDRLLGSDPQRVRSGLLKNLRRMLDEDFDALLFAHGPPASSGGRALLTDFLEAHQTP